MCGRTTISCAGWKAEGADSQPCQRDEVGKDKTIWMQLQSCPPSPTSPFKHTNVHFPSRMKKFGLCPPSSTSHSFLCVCTCVSQQGRNVHPTGNCSCSVSGSEQSWRWWISQGKSLLMRFMAHFCRSQGGCCCSGWEMEVEKAVGNAPAEMFFMHPH